MSAALTIDRIPEAPSQSKARLAGFFWLTTAVTGSMAFFFTQGVVVAGNPAATAANFTAHELLYRSGIAANLIATACYITATLLVYELLKPVNKSVSMLAALFSLTGCAASAVGLVLGLSPMVILARAPYLRVFTVQQVQALAFTFWRVSVQSETIGFLFFGLHCFLVGCLLVRSGFLPKAVGVLMVLAGLGWLTLSLSRLLSPAFAQFLTPAIMAPGAIGEITLSLWLLIAGVRVRS